MIADKTFSLVAVLLVSSALSAGCGRRAQEWSADGPTRYCVDAQGRRVPDDQCGGRYVGGGANPFLWYYLGSMAGRRSFVPAMGGYAAGGGYAPAAGVRYGAPALGARGFAGGVARGGFGGIGAGLGAGMGAGE